MSVDRFMAKVRVAENGCWLWTASTTAGGYGRFSLDGGTVMAHRWAYEHFAGPIPEGLTLDHQCHNRDLACAGGNDCPHRACVNPAHLEPAKLRANILRGRGAAAKLAVATVCKLGHPLSGENVYIRPDGHRACRRCKRLRSRAANQTDARKTYNRELQQGEKRKAYIRDYNERNAEKNKAYQREYYAKHRERAAMLQRARKQADPEAAAARQREYTRRYLEKKRAEKAA